MSGRINILKTVFLIGSGFCILCSGNLTEEASRSNSVSNATKTLNTTVHSTTTSTVPPVIVTLPPIVVNQTTTTTSNLNETVTTTTTPIPPLANTTIVQGVSVESNSTISSANVNQTILASESTAVTLNTTTSTTPAPNETDPRAYLDTYVAPIDIQVNFPYYHAGYDPDNRPIWVIEGGKWNVRSIVERGPEAMEHFEKFALQGFYRAEQSINASSTDEIPVTDEVLIVDFEGLSLLQIAHLPTVKFLLHLAQEIRYFLLKHLHIALVVNTNSVAHTLINLVRPIFARAFEHIEIFGTNRDKWLPHVLRYCPRDQIPAWYGGVKDFKPLKVYG